MSGEQLDTRPGDLIQRPILEPGNVTVVADLWGAHGHRNNQLPTAQKNPFMLFVAVGLTLVFYMPYGILELKNTSFQTWWGVYR